MLRGLDREFASLRIDLQTKVFSQFRRIINAEKNRLSRTDGVFHPILNKFDIVKVSMIGLGTVMNDNHYAVVWDAPLKSETIVVLPITSNVEPGRERFAIGSLDGLTEPDHSIDANQPQTITRKSIINYPTKTDATGKPIPVKLNEAQQIIVLDLFHKSIMKEPSLKTVLMEKIGDKIPTGLDQEIRNDFNRAVTYFVQHDFVYYKLPESDNVKTIPVASLLMRISERKRMINDMASNNPRVREAAERNVAQKIAQRAVDEAAAGISPGGLTSN